MASTPFLGCKISLISKSEIRYEGILYTIDPKESTIALAKVRSFGTENRSTDRPVPARDEVFEYIIFRASDIKDLIVDDPPTSLTGLADPAIIQAHSVSNAPNLPGGGTLTTATVGGPNAAAGSGPGAAVGGAGGPQSSQQRPGSSSAFPNTAALANPPITGMPLFGMASSVGSRSGASTPATTGGAARKSPDQAQQQQRQQQPRGQGGMQHNQRAGPIGQGRVGGFQGHQQQQQQQLAGQSQQNRRGPGTGRVMDNRGGIQPGLGHQQHQGYDNRQRQQPLMHGQYRDTRSQTQNYRNQGWGPTGGGGGPGGPGGMRHGGGPGLMDARGPRQGAGFGHPLAPPGGFRGRPQGFHQRGGMGGGGGGGGGYGHQGDRMNRGPRQGGPGGTGNVHQRAQPLKLEGEFDFEKANEEFEKLEEKLKMVKLADGKQAAGSDSESKDGGPADGGADAAGTTTESGGDKSSTAAAGEPEEISEPRYDKGKSFFDAISCEALEREKGKQNRPDWKHERKVNTETFGVSGSYNNRRGGMGMGGFRRPYGSQGGQRSGPPYGNRNYNNGGGGGGRGGYNNNNNRNNNANNASNNSNNAERSAPRPAPPAAAAAVAAK